MISERIDAASTISAWGVLRHRSGEVLPDGLQLDVVILGIFGWITCADGISPRAPSLLSAPRAVSPDENAPGINTGTLTVAPCAAAGLESSPSAA
jgi:hypothetical protein